MFKKDTIAAISTGMSNSGIGIVRISGEDALQVIDKIYKGKKILSEVDSHTIHYGFIKDDDETIDEVLVTVMRAPRTFTGEDTVEINCHGGVFVVKRILETVLKYGARPAEPGEFTKRAFLNGKMDLSQAEAVIDVINSKNEYALKSSISQLKGSVKEKISKIREEILYHTAFIETALDDPEHISVDGYGEKLSGVVDNLCERIHELIATSENGRIIKEGIQTVILGKPNAGKSSLLNVLSGYERAIVTDIEGTTRDVLEEQVQIRGLNLNIMDTAGIRSTDDVVEKIGVDKAKEYAKDADLIIYVADASRELDENDKDIIELIYGKKAIILLNKSDLNTVLDKESLAAYMTEKYDELNQFKNNNNKNNDKDTSEIFNKKANVKEESLKNETGKEASLLNDKFSRNKEYQIIEISAKEETGIREFEEVLTSMFLGGDISFNDEVYITNLRQKAALTDACQSLEKVLDSIEMQMPEDFYSIDLMDAYEALGSITGETIGEDLVNEIFSKFCMGK